MLLCANPRARLSWSTWNCPSVAICVRFAVLCRRFFCCTSFRWQGSSMGHGNDRDYSLLFSAPSQVRAIWHCVIGQEYALHWSYWLNRWAWLWVPAFGIHFSSHPKTMELMGNYGITFQYRIWCMHFSHVRLGSISSPTSSKREFFSKNIAEKQRIGNGVCDLLALVIAGFTRTCM